MSGEGGRRGRGEGGEGVGSEGGMSTAAAAAAVRSGVARLRGEVVAAAARHWPVAACLLESTHTRHISSRACAASGCDSSLHAPLLKEEVVAHKQLPAGRLGRQ